MIKKIFIKHNNYGITTLHKTPFCGIMAPLGMQIISKFATCKDRDIVSDG